MFDRLSGGATAGRVPGLPRIRSIERSIASVPLSQCRSSVGLKTASELVSRHGTKFDRGASPGEGLVWVQRSVDHTKRHAYIRAIHHRRCRAGNDPLSGSSRSAGGRIQIGMNRPCRSVGPRRDRDGGEILGDGGRMPDLSAEFCQTMPSCVSCSP